MNSTSPKKVIPNLTSENEISSQRDRPHTKNSANFSKKTSERDLSPGDYVPCAGNF